MQNIFCEKKIVLKYKTVSAFFSVSLLLGHS